MAEASVADQIKVLRIYPPASDGRAGAGTILAVLDCQIGPFLIKGASLFARDNASSVVRMPKCKVARYEFEIWDAAWKRELKAKAWAAYNAMQGVQGRIG